MSNGGFGVGLLATLLVAACSGSPSSTGDTDPATTDTEAMDTAPPPPPTPVGFGSIALHGSDFSGELVLFGVFGDGPFDGIDPAGCLDSRRICVLEEPALDSWLPRASPAPILDGRFVGPRVHLGPVAADYEVLEGTYASGPLNQHTPPGRSYGLRFAGADPWSATEDELSIDAPPAFEVLRPDLSTDEVSDLWMEDRPFAIEWEAPNPDTPLVLELFTVATLPGGIQHARRYALDNDGSFEIPPGDLELNDANQSLQLVLGTTSEVMGRAGGGEVRIRARRESSRVVDRPPLQLRSAIPLADSCDLALDHPIPAGATWVDLTGFSDTVTNLDALPVSSRDAFGVVQLQPGERLTLRAEAFLSDAHLGLRLGCDAYEVYRWGGGNAERVQYTNTTGAARAIIVEIDTGAITLSPLVMLDLAIDVPEGTPTSPCGGSSVTSSILDLDLGELGFTVPGLPAGDATSIPVHVPPGGVLRARSRVLSHLYLRENCGMGGWDALAPGYPLDVLEYENPSVAPYEGWLWLVDPARMGTGPIRHEVQIADLQPSPAVGQGSTGVPALQRGLHHFSGHLSAATSDFATVCNVNPLAPVLPTAEDAVLDIRLEPGERMVASFTQSDASGVLYLRDGNADLDCQRSGAVGATARLEYVNLTGSTQTPRLVADTDSSQPSFGPGGAYTLTVAIEEPW